jgi:hypothetical protein
MRDFVKLPALKVESLTSEYDRTYGDFDKKDLVVEVVGINPYAGKNGNGDGAHLAFQFQKSPVFAPIGGNPVVIDAPNTNGYAATYMRKYLVPVEGAAGSGKFLAGLLAAGVPESALWAPKRVTGGTFSPWDPKGAYEASVKAKTSTISDVLYLPTVWEVNNGSLAMITYYPSKGAPATGGENDSNQGVLRAYNSDSARGDKGSSMGGWWLASASGDTCGFIGVYGGKFYYSHTGEHCGVAPVFCVK